MSLIRVVKGLELPVEFDGYFRIKLLKDYLHEVQGYTVSMDGRITTSYPQDYGLPSGLAITTATLLLWRSEPPVDEDSIRYIKRLAMRLGITVENVRFLGKDDKVVVRLDLSYGRELHD